MIGLALLVLLLIYCTIGCGAAYLLGRIDEHYPPWGAVIWPVIIPLALFVAVLEWFNDLGARHSRRGE